MPHERHLALAPAPPATRTLAAVGKVAHRRGAVAPDEVEHAFHVFGLIAGKLVHRAIGAIAVQGAVHAPAHEGMQVERHKACLMGPALEHGALPVAEAAGIKRGVFIMAQS
jgi:hypothetical protein